VKTDNVATWADWYRLPERLQCHEASRVSLLSNPNIKAQVFHAYVGAVFLEDRMLGVEEWIRTLINYQNNLEASDSRTEREHVNQSNYEGMLTPEPELDIQSGSSFVEEDTDSLDGTTMVPEASELL
jgi:dsRNA-specific ribonuclease